MTCRFAARFVLAIACLSLGGCAFFDAITAPRDLAAYQKALNDAQATSAALHTQLDTLQATFAATNDAKIKDGIAVLQAGLLKVDATIPVLNAAVADAKAAGQSHTTLLSLLAFAIVPYALPLLKGVPVVGPVLEPVAEIAWHAYASTRQKAADEAAHAALVDNRMMAASIAMSAATQPAPLVPPAPRTPSVIAPELNS